METMVIMVIEIAEDHWTKIIYQMVLQIMEWVVIFRMIQLMKLEASMNLKEKLSRMLRLKMDLGLSKNSSRNLIKNR
jgi:hypothetical protein